MSTDVMTTRKQREMMEHAIGMPDVRGKRGPQPGWRNYYCASIPSPEAESWRALVASGLAIEGRTLNGEEAVYFHVSDAGFAELGLNPPKPEAR